MHRVRYNNRNIELFKVVQIWEVRTLQCIPQINIIIKQNKLSYYSLIDVLHAEAVLLNSILLN